MRHEPLAFPCTSREPWATGRVEQGHSRDRVGQSRGRGRRVAPGSPPPEPCSVLPYLTDLVQAEIAEGKGVALLRYSFVAVIVRLACACYKEEAAVSQITATPSPLCPPPTSPLGHALAAPGKLETP